MNRIPSESTPQCKRVEIVSKDIRQRRQQAVTLSKPKEEKKNRRHEHKVIYINLFTCGTFECNGSFSNLNFSVSLQMSQKCSC